MPMLQSKLKRYRGMHPFVRPPPNQMDNLKVCLLFLVNSA